MSAKEGQDKRRKRRRRRRENRKKEEEEKERKHLGIEQLELALHCIAGTSASDT